MPVTPQVREQLSNAIQGTVAVDNDLPEGAMLMGWVTVAEWMAPDGNRWLSYVDGDANDSSLPSWQREGYLHSTLFDTGVFSEDDDG